MSKHPFNKPATTFAQQVALLQSRGMVIADPAQAEFWLAQLNYYRLGAYWLPFEASHASHTFRPGTRFDDVLGLYFFDRELRLLVLDAIERVEVSLRTQWAYQLAHAHGPHAHLQAALFDERYWLDNLGAMNREVQRSKEVFIKHLRDTYVEPLPPVWAVCEVMSLGLLSRWFDSLKPMPTRRVIAKPFGLDDGVLQSWLQHLTHVRNTCAHHARLWNREFTVTPQAPRSKPARLVGLLVPGSRKLYNTLLIVTYLLDVMAPKHHLRERLKHLLGEHAIPLTAMDFPVDWETVAFWQEAAP
ncbi:Abi family protein [Oleiagrimonas sp.]|jgi:abortive infection bacteriophage resistance protein|uniref:Abi family protein n=1 Tax=Oleiagrimonas sp. TaxID=2010330 RepID=UPI0026059CC2|nr:Abi family protein [Oleiagrimonas sp.]MDA3915283.1 Abi family protein [Oleiagrimonas sp.]